MSDDDDAAYARADRLRNILTGALGMLGLLAWLALLWFMFGDVL